MVPISTATNTVGTPISAGYRPGMIAITPDGTTAYVAYTPANHGGLFTRSVVRPITTATNTVGKTIMVARTRLKANYLNAMAFTPSGNTLYVLGHSSGTGVPGFLVAINTATNKASRHFAVGPDPSTMAITP